MWSLYIFYVPSILFVVHTVLLEHFYTIIWKLINVLLKNIHILIHWGVGRQPNCLQIYCLPERHAFQSMVLMLGHPVVDRKHYNLVNTALYHCKYPYTGCGRITPIVFHFSTEQTFIDFDIPVQYVEYTNSQNISLTWLPKFTDVWLYSISALLADWGRHDHLNNVFWKQIGREWHNYNKILLKKKKKFSFQIGEYCNIERNTRLL
jgi:hypothetical protein